MDEAVGKLRSKGIQVTGVVCHVSNPQQRKDLVDKTVQVTDPLLLVNSQEKGSFPLNVVICLYNSSTRCEIS